MHSFCGTSLRTEYNMLISVLRLILSAGFIDKCRQICFALHIQRQTKIADIRKAHLNAFQAFKVGFNSSLIKIKHRRGSFAGEHGNSGVYVERAAHIQ